MDRQQHRSHAIKIARESALAHNQDHSYLPQSRMQADTWTPHEWVILAIEVAALPHSQSSMPAQLSPPPAAPGIDMTPFRRLVEACEAEFSGEGTEAMEPDDSKVSYPEERCNITFGMIRSARKALDASSKGGSDALQIPDTDGVREILGRLCFQCIRIAELLRFRGDEIKRRAEDEQAAVLRFLLNHYLAAPEKWAENAQSEIDAMRKKATMAGGEG